MVGGRTIIGVFPKPRFIDFMRPACLASLSAFACVRKRPDEVLPTLLHEGQCEMGKASLHSTEPPACIQSSRHPPSTFRIATPGLQPRSRSCLTLLASSMTGLCGPFFRDFIAPLVQGFWSWLCTRFASNPHGDPRHYGLSKSYLWALDRVPSLHQVSAMNYSSALLSCLISQPRHVKDREWR